MIRKLTLILGMALPIIPAPAHAVFGEEDWLSGQNQLLASLLGEQAQSTTQLLKLVVETRNILDAANETAAFARTTFRQVEFIRNYTLDDLYEDAQIGFYKAFPEFKEMDEEIRMAIANGHAIKEGEFWSHTDAHDRGAIRRLTAKMHYALRGSIWRQSPETKNLYAPSPVDLHLEKYFKSTGQQGQRAIQAQSYVTFAESVRSLSKHARKSDHLPTEIASHNAEMNTQTMRSTTELLDHQKAKTAQEQNSRVRDRKARKAFSKGMSKAFKNFGKLRSTSSEAR